MGMFLSEAEVQELTGKERGPAQERALKFMGIKFKPREDGSIVILRAHVAELFGGVEALWQAEEIGKFLKLAAKTVQNSMPSWPDFPKAILLPTGGRRWLPGEVTAWAESCVREKD